MHRTRLCLAQSKEPTKNLALKKKKGILVQKKKRKARERKCGPKVTGLFTSRPLLAPYEPFLSSPHAFWSLGHEAYWFSKLDFFLKDGKSDEESKDFSPLG